MKIFPKKVLTLVNPLIDLSRYMIDNACALNSAYIPSTFCHITSSTGMPSCKLRWRVFKVPSPGY